MGLAIASGSLFALQVNSNFFWMFKALLGLTTQGSLKTMTTVTSIASLVSLPIVLVLALVVAAFVCLYERIERAVRRRSQMKR